MTKTELVLQIAKAQRITTAQAHDMLDTVLDLIMCHLTESDDVLRLRGFGTFRTKLRRAYVQIVPKTGKPKTIPPTRILYFKPSREFLERINYGG